MRLPGSNEIYAADVFARLFSAHVFCTVEKRLESRFPNDDLLLVWSVGCPMDHLDEADRKSEWEKMAGVAMQLHKEGVDLSSAAVLADVAVRLEAFVLPVESERNFLVLPEGLAAVKAFLESPHAESKTHAIVDVGLCA